MTTPTLYALIDSLWNSRVAARWALPLLASTVLANCATGPRIYSSENPNVDFSSYRTYSYVDALGTDEPGEPTSLLTQFLMTAIDREMQARGYEHSDEGGELLVNFYVDTQEKIQSRTARPSGPYVGVSYYRFRSGLYIGWQDYAETDVSQYTEGTLNIDLADAARKELIWEGIAIGRVTEETRRDVQAAVDAVVPRIFDHYPYRNGP